MKLIVCGLSPLEVYALEALAPDWNVMVADDGMPSGGDAYMVSPQALAHNMDFFISHRSGLIVYVGQSYDVVKQKLGAIAASRRDERAQDQRMLSVREKEVLREIASGKTNKEIAEALCISVNTAITHRKNLSAKLGIKSASGLSLYALMNGII